MHSSPNTYVQQHETGFKLGLPERCVPWALVLLAWSLQVAVIWSRRYPPLIDYPNHMARHYYESLWLRGINIPSWYRVDYRLIPNLGGDLVIPLLIMFFPPQIAGKLFLTAAVFVYWVGAAVYIRQMARPSSGVVPAALLLLPFVIEGSFCWGFLNYYSGVGLSFLSLAHQDRIIRRRTISRFELILHAACVSVLFVWHLAVWATYGSLAACRVSFEISQRLKESGKRREGYQMALMRPVAVAATVLPSLLLFFLYKVSASGSSAVNLGLVGRSIWSSLPRKVLYFRGITGAYDWRMALLVLVLWAGAALSWFKLRLAPTATRNPLPILGLGVLTFLFIIIPDTLGTISAADARLVPAIIICALTAVAGIPMSRPRVGACFLALCIMAKYVETHRAWARLGSRLDGYAEAFALMAPNSRLLPINIPGGVSSKEQPETHFHCWAAIERNAYDPGLSTLVGQFPLRRSLPEFCPTKIDLSAMRLKDLSNCYDYLWVMNRDGRTIDLPSGFQPVFVRHWLTLYRINP